MLPALDISAQKEHTLHRGQSFYYSFYQHISVGIDLEYKHDATLVKFIRLETHYEFDPNAVECGGDAAQCKVIFEALKPGQTEIQFLHLFRGDIEKIHIRTLTIKA